MGEENMNRKPSLLIFAGPNGSGKSTVTSLFKIVGDYTNADDIVKSSGMSNLEAAQYVESIRLKALQEKEDLTFETVLSADRYVEFIKKAHELGYFIKVVFVLTSDSSMNVFRVRARVNNGGHDVPADKIKSRYIKSLTNLSRIIPYCDIVHVYDNSDTACRIFRKHKDEPIKIIPNKYWSRNDIERLISGSYDFVHKNDYLVKEQVTDNLPEIDDLW